MRLLILIFLIINEHYLGDSFYFDTAGGNPAGWTIDEEGGTINVIAEVGNHKKVVELDK